MMTPEQPRRLRLITHTTALVGLTTALVLAPSGGPQPAPGAAEELRPVAAARAANPVTPGNFTGFGFDQCLTPEQWKMDRWLHYSPFLAVGIYISGNSRFCRSQPNLTPAWVRTQLARGWKLLPITLGPQASCNPRFPRYRDDPKIIADPGRTGRYDRARAQAVAEANKTVAVARRLGIAAGSLLWYDLEAFDHTRTRCRESALHFLSAYTVQIRRWGYKSGVYSSAGSGIRMLDDARVQRPRAFALPDAIWIARWDGRANTSTSYIRPDGWLPGRRMKQYQGGHNETWGGVRINIDRNWLDLGRGSVAVRERHCGGKVNIDQLAFWRVAPRTDTWRPDWRSVMVLKCMFRERGWLTKGDLSASYGRWIRRAVVTWHQRTGLAPSTSFDASDWVRLHTSGAIAVLKYGSSGRVVFRLQRALNAGGARIPVTGVFDVRTHQAVRAYQKRHRLTVNGIANWQTWTHLRAGRV